MKLIYTLFTLSFLFLSCSNSSDDNHTPNDAIIGDWKIIKRYQNNNEVPLIVCDEFWVTEFNQTYYNRIVPENANIPNGYLCGITPSTMVKWIKISASSYELRRTNNNDLFGTITFEGENIVIDFTYEDEKLELQRINL